MLIQCGFHTNSSNGATSSETVTLPMPYSNTKYAIVYVYERTSSGDEGFNHYNDITEISFKIGYDTSSETR